MTILIIMITLLILWTLFEVFTFILYGMFLSKYIFVYLSIKNQLKKELPLGWKIYHIGAIKNWKELYKPTDRFYSKSAYKAYSYITLISEVDDTGKVSKIHYDIDLSRKGKILNFETILTNIKSKESEYLISFKQWNRNKIIENLGI